MTVPNKPVYTVYFLDLAGPPRIGFTGCADEIWRTSDGGKIWTKCASGIPVPCDFTFKDSLVGWVTSRGAALGGAVLFRTTDGGKSWVGQSNGFTSAEGIYYNHSSHLLFFASWQNGLWSSNDEGLSWLKIYSPKYASSGIDFSDDQQYGVATNASGNTTPLCFTFDAGASWSIGTNNNGECWQPHFIGNTKSFIGPFENSGNGPARSDDGGATWYNLKSRNIDASLTGDIRGRLCRLYCQTWQQATFQSAGIYRSFDEGLNWDFIGGPLLSNLDCRFWTRDRYVYAGDALGNVFYLYDTIGTPFSARLAFDSNIVIFDTVNQCSEGSVVLHFSNFLNCDSLRITNMSLGGSGAGMFKFVSPTNAPRVLAPQAKDSVILFFPKITTGSFTALLKITIKHDNYSHDTIITIKGVRSLAPNATLSSHALDFDTIATCTAKELITTIYNSGCDTETVHITTPTSDYSIIEPTTDTVLYPGDSAVIRIQLRSTQIGIHTDNIVATITPKNFPKLSFTILLDGFIERKVPAPQIAPARLDFDSLSICDSIGKTLSLHLTNRSGCDSLHIDSLWITDDPLFSISTNDGFSIAPSGTDSIILHCSSGLRGDHSGSIHIRYSDGNILHDTIIALQAAVYSGKGILSTKETALDFGSTSLCSEKDTTITLQNTGCDTLWVTATTLQGSGFIVEDATPFFILPGQSKTIPVSTTIDSTNHQSTNNAQISFTTNADNSISPIGLIRHLNYPSSYPVKFSVSSPSGANQSQLSMNILADSLPTGLTRLDAMLSIGNKDLLSFIDYQSKNQVSINGDQITITGNPITTDNGNLAELHYKVYLTKDSTSDISFKNIIFNNADADYANCIATVQGGADNSFDYEFICGERTISSFLKNGELRINSISPNPTRGEITLSLDSPTKQEATIEIYDILGKQVYSSSKPIFKGNNTISIDIQDLSRGRFLIRITGLSTMVSTVFIKQ